MAPTFRFYDPSLVSKVTCNRLTHWEQVGATYFITFRLADAVPSGPLVDYVREKREWLAANPEPRSTELEKEYHRRFSRRFERWLDRGHGSCILSEAANAKIMSDAMRHFEGERSILHAWVVMPNHVHALFSQIGETPLGSLLHSWKSFSARQINQRTGNNGSIWQKSYFDRMVRDWDHFANCARYIRNNPLKAKLPPGTYQQGESAFVSKMLGVAASGQP